MANNEWYTPDIYLTMVREVIGDIDLDPFSNEEANKRVRAKRIFTKEDSAFENVWEGHTLFMNPPYSRELIGKSVARFFDQFLGCHGYEAIVLTNSATSTKWYQDLLFCCDRVCYPNHRIRFISSDGVEGKSPRYDQTFFYFGKNVDQFFETFSSIGTCLVGKLYD